MIKESAGEKIFNVLNVLFMIFLVLVLVPLLYVLLVSFSVPSGYMRYTGSLLWKPVGASALVVPGRVRNGGIWTGYRNTLFIVTSERPSTC
jgi:putative aldouronate transport system permease protein